MKQDKPFVGILLMLGFCIVAPMGDAVAKLLGGEVPLGQLLIVRFGVQVLCLAPFLFLVDLRWLKHFDLLGFMVLRTVMHIAGIGMMVTALIYLPLADAVAIAFVLPFIMLLLGHWFLGEEVGYRRLIACGVGFVGTLMVVQPAFRDVGWPALLPLGVAVNFAFFMLITRFLAKDADALSLQAVSGGVAVVILVPLLALIPAETVADLAWVNVDGGTWTLLILLGLFGTLAHLLMTWSLRYAPSATLAPMQYLEIPAATLIGWLVFRELPNGLAALGILVTIAAGLYVLLRERAIARAQLSVRLSMRSADTPAE